MYTYDLEVNKAIFAIRNPLDMLVSFACLFNTCNHSIKPEYSFSEDYPEWWDFWVKTQTKMFKRYLDLLMAEVKSNKYPIHIVRYEDLVLDK